MILIIFAAIISAIITAKFFGKCDAVAIIIAFAALTLAISGIVRYILNTLT